MKEKDLVFNPVAYAKVCAKQDAKGRTTNNRVHGTSAYEGKKESNAYYGHYYDSKKGYGKVWDAVKDWHNSREW